MKRFHALLFFIGISSSLFFGIANSSQLLAATPESTDAYYQIEVIVFSRSGRSSGNAEVWPPLAVASLPLKRELLDPAVNGSDKFMPLPATQYQLQGVWDALDRAANFAPLVYTAWIQPALVQDQAKAVSVAAGTSQLLLPTQQQNAQQSAAVFSDQTTNTSTQADTQVPHLISPLDGAVTIVSDYYLYANVDFIYTPNGIQANNHQNRFTPATPQPQGTSGTLNKAVLQALANGSISLEEAMQRRNSDAQSAQNDTLSSTMRDALMAPGNDEKSINGYRLNQNRRIKLNELHYFDHPAFGVFVRVSPYEIPTTQ